MRFDDDDLKTITAISDALNTSLATVEVLPGSIEQWQTDPAVPFLLVDRNLGLPQKLLYKLYPFASSLLRQLRSTSSSSFPSSSPATTTLLNACSIILITNPAHYTALNQRKRLILSGHLSMKQELHFSTLLLSSSRLASKQSILWDYRRWLFQTQYNDEGHSGLIPAALLREELDAILQSCETHPRNYYAWAHWEFCLESLHDACINTTMAKDEYSPVIAYAFSQLLRWIEHHLSDYTAAHHLCRLVHRFHELKVLEHWLDFDLTFSRLLKQVISLLTRYTDHEALWMYLRALWAINEDQAFRDDLEALLLSLPTCKYREQCISWFNIALT
ncbi:hypothetical protein J3R30DRAFT_1834381 [Lentinula aciculospora]|uniref:Protein prenylyltransferase n=1 Tax=Lentinula aciculospora TaxID=153920 RepID=A0A9W9AKC7_9AGAR|nr:hypothetical protein J3R30DRAFT_1834381 [Lentinula aciculospora]